MTMPIERTASVLLATKYLQYRMLDPARRDGEG
jgi:hypothetical protein